MIYAHLFLLPVYHYLDFVSSHQQVIIRPKQIQAISLNWGFIHELLFFYYR